MSRSFTESSRRQEGDCKHFNDNSGINSCDDCVQVHIDWTECEMTICELHVNVCSRKTTCVGLARPDKKFILLGGPFQTLNEELYYR